MKDSFILYNSFYEPIKELKNEQLGKLLRAIFDYTINGEITQDSDILVAFMFIKNQIDIDTKKWEDTKEKRKYAGMLGGIQKAINNGQELSSKSKQSLDMLSNAKQTQANQAVNENENENENVNDNVNVINKNNNRYIVEQAIDYMNELAGTSFKKTTAKTKSLINARLKEGFDIEDLKDVIYYKYHEWYKQPFEFKNGISSKTYYRPNTLFGTKFEEYLQQYKQNAK